MPSCELYPKPTQKPHPPIYCGGETVAALRRVATHCNDWITVDNSPEVIKAGVDKLKPLLDDVERSLSDIKIHHAPFDPNIELDTVKRYRDAGVNQIVLVTRSTNADELLRDLDHWAERLVEPAKNM